MDTQHKRPPLLVFSDDWGRHPSSAQHLIGHLLAHQEVIWVNTIGTRPISLDLRTARRAVEKLRHWLTGAASTRKTPNQQKHAGDNPQTRGPRVIAPLMWPSFSKPWSRLLNRFLLERSLRRVIRDLPCPPVVLTTLPIVADLAGRLPAARWVYYCVDDFGSWPGYDGATMRQMELDLVPRVNASIAVSDTLVQHLRRMGADPVLLTHGVDRAFWTMAGRPDQPPAEFEGLQGPLILFWGLVDQRMEVDWIRCLSETLEARQLPGTIVLLGPQDAPDPALGMLPRVRTLPAVTLNALPAIASLASVLVMPYRNIAATQAMQPLKLKEYLATGKPVIVRHLPATQEWADACDLCASSDEFVDRVLQRIDQGIPADQAQARARLGTEAWANKARVLEAVLFVSGPSATKVST